MRKIHLVPSCERQAHARCTACDRDCGDGRGILGRRGAVHAEPILRYVFLPVLTELDDRIPEGEVF